MAPRDLIITRLSKCHRQTSSLPTTMLWDQILLHPAKLCSNLLLILELPLALHPHLLRESLSRRNSMSWKRDKRSSKKKSSRELRKYRPTLRLCTCILRSCSKTRIRRLKISRCSRMKFLNKLRRWMISFWLSRNREETAMVMKFLSTLSMTWLIRG